MSMPQIVHYPDAESLAKALAGTIVGRLSETVERQGSACLVLPGGTSPVLLIKNLAEHNLPWEKITVTTTDERIVPESHAESNIGQIRRLLGNAPANYLSLQEGKGKIGSALDGNSVMVVGMGTDGHIASLFPDGRAIGDDDLLCRVEAPKPPNQRISLTMQGLLIPETIHLLVIGAEKRRLCKEVLEGAQQGLPLASLVREAGSRLILHVA